MIVQPESQTEVCATYGIDKLKFVGHASEMTQLSGKSIIGFERASSDDGPFHGIDPRTGQKLDPTYYSADAYEVDQAVRLADKAFEAYRESTGRIRGLFLRQIAESIEALGEHLVTRAVAETGLRAARIRTETVRTCNQLRLFAELVEEGSWVDARIDRADPNRAPLRKPEVRSMLHPLGPVVVFCASNFPLAFSVAGGDTASALASGNPVIVKAHHAHPGTAELIGLAVSAALQSCDLPEGVFSLLFGPGSEVGMDLMRHPLIKAGGFTGSRSGGRALMNAAFTRPDPIPFYAEMSSVNPVFILPSVVRDRAEEIATGLHASVTLGVGQFCTNPGLVFLPERGCEALVRNVQELMAATPPLAMLTSAIASAYRQGVAALQQDSLVTTIAKPKLEPYGNAALAGAALFQTDASSFLADQSLSAEVFGPSTLLVTYSSTAQLLEVARALEGQLTSTIHATPAELAESDELIRILETKSGRLLFNGYPTGVEVGPAMVHGGPYPATSDSRSTSVGTRAALRFVRPVCYQDWPDAELPAALKDANPLQIWRMVNGEMTRESLVER